MRLHGPSAATCRAPRALDDDLHAPAIQQSGIDRLPRRYDYHLGVKPADRD